jgi:hypothetical protein
MMFFRQVSLLLGFVALTVLSSAISANAETVINDSHSLEADTTLIEEVESAAIAVSPINSLPINSTSSQGSLEATAALTEDVESTETVTSTVKPQVASTPSVTEIPEDTTQQHHLQPANDAAIKQNQADSQQQPLDVALDDEQGSASSADSAIEAPTPGTVETSADLLSAQPEFAPVPEASSDAAASEADTTVAQTEIDPGRPTRGGASYVGIGGNIGIDGDTALGRGSFVINGKIGLTRTLSFRPAAIIGDDTVFLFPLTYDFRIQSTDPFEPVRFAPFVGGGLALSTDEDDNLGFMVTGGVDFPLSPQFVANAALNIGFLEDTTDFGLMVGIGYTFVSF